MDSGNLFGVRVTKAGVVSDWDGVPLSRDEAIVHAVWLFAVADPKGAAWMAGVCRHPCTEFERLLVAITRPADSAIAD